jgi:hypothetical protein
MVLQEEVTTTRHVKFFQHTPLRWDVALLNDGWVDEEVTKYFISGNTPIIIALLRRKTSNCSL